MGNIKFEGSSQYALPIAHHVTARAEGAVVAPTFVARRQASARLGLADRTGSLRKGKRADVIMVSTREVNIGPFTEPAYMLVDSAQASNVDTVLVDGRILKRNGKLTAIDAGKLMDEASGATQSIKQRANWK